MAAVHNEHCLGLAAKAGVDEHAAGTPEAAGQNGSAASGAAPAGVVDKPVDAKAEAAAGDAVPARTDAAEEAASAGTPAPSRAKKRPQRSRKPKAAHSKPASPDDFIRQTVGEAGPDGVAVAELARQVRARFKSFKVRDLGYPHMAGYLADVEGVRVYKQGRENWVAKE